MERNQAMNYSKTRSKTQEVVINGLLIAIVFVATRFINIPSPVSAGGLVHLGNVALFTIAIIYGAKKGAIAGAFGMGLFDLLSPYAAWAPFTFVVRGVMGYIIGAVSDAGGKKGQSILFNLLAILMGSIWMLAGYYLTEVVLTSGNWIEPVKSIPGNLIQIAIGTAAGIPLAAAVKKFKID